MSFNAESSEDPRMSQFTGNVFFNWEWERYTFYSHSCEAMLTLNPSDPLIYDRHPR